jgi:pimeloyl-ACP methyl ester carboxylesterase
MDWDVRDVLPRISAPTIVITEADGYLFDRQQDLDNARYLAEHIPNARFVDSPKPDWYFLGDHGRIILEAIETLVREVAEAWR